MISPWISNSIQSIFRRPLSNNVYQIPVTAQVLSFDEDTSMIVVHDKEYFISGCVSSDLKDKIIKNKPEYSQRVSNGYILIKYYVISKANIPDENNECIRY